jgi:hypothetical protein
MAFGSHQLVFENFILKPYLKYYKEVNPLFAHTSHQQLVEEMRKGAGYSLPGKFSSGYIRDCLFTGLLRTECFSVPGALSVRQLSLIILEWSISQKIFFR